MNIIDALQQINKAADSAHSRQHQPAYNLTQTHNRMASEAEDFLAARCPSHISSYPIIEAEAATTKRTPREAANDIIKRRNEYLHPSDKIEATRKIGKEKVYKDGVNIQEVVNGIIKELDQI